MDDHSRTTEQLVEALTELTERCRLLEEQASTQQRLMADLQEQTKFFQAIIDLNPNPTFVKDREGRFILANPAFAAIFGRTPEEIAGLLDADILEPDRLESARRWDADVLDNQRIFVEPPVPRVYPSGQTHWVKTIKLPLAAAGGSPDLLLNVINDVSELKEAEVELRGYATQLERNELAQARQNLELENQKKALNRVNRAYKVLIEGNQAVTRAVDEQTLLQQICQVLIAEGGYRLAWVGFKAAGDVGPLRPAAYAAAGGKTVDLTELAAGEVALTESPSNLALSTGRPRICENMLANPDFAFWHAEAGRLGLTSFIALPLRENQRSLGVLHVYAGEPNAFALQEVHLLMELADDLAFGLTALRTRVQRQQSEEALRHSEVYFRSLIDNALDIVTILNGDGTIRYESPAIERVLGYQTHELVGRPAFEYIHPDDLPGVLEIFKTRIGTLGPAPTFETRFRHKDGSWRYLEISGNNLLEDPVVGGVIINSRDITERKLAEEAATRLGKMLDDSLNEIYTFDGETLRFVQVNQGARENLGYSLAELQQMTPLDLKPEITPEKFEQLLSPLRRGERGKIQFATVHQRKDGTVYPVEVNLQLTAQGDAQLFVAVIVDISERKQIEEQIRRQERLAAVGQLAVGIAHDFNNIMAIITLYTQLLKTSPNLQEKEKQQLETIFQQATHAADLTGQILDFSRQSMIKRKPLDLLSLMEEVTQLLVRTLPEDIKIELSCPSGEFPVNADSTRLRQVVMNLALNARDAMPNGGRLHFSLERIKTRPRDRLFSLKIEPGDWVALRVTDNGSGIPVDVLPHLFEPFFTTKPPGQGTGLGLAQVYGIIKQHEGFIDVESEAGHGTTFMLVLPLLSGGETRPLVEDSFALVAGKGQTILVVEDNAATLDALVDSLKTLNYQVLTATNGFKALAILEQGADDIDLVLSDMVMPEMGGRGLLKALQARQINTPMVILTGHPLADELDDLREQGLHEWVTKPITIEKLAHVIAAALDEG